MNEQSYENETIGYLLNLSDKDFIIYIDQLAKDYKESQHLDCALDFEACVIRLRRALKWISKTWTQKPLLSLA